MNKDNTPPNDLLGDEEYSRIHMMEHEEYEKLSEDLKEEYERTQSWHFAQRVGNTKQSTKDLIVDGVPADKFEEYRRGVDSQTPAQISTSPYAPVSKGK